ncbi:MAG: FAD-dependent monooxygenase [Proteobacteria bacterium]|nr:FAD-dependent monooxygenase [Pseudomonadota bacterium]
MNLINGREADGFDTAVLVAGGGPVGLLLAHELAWQGVDCVLVERNATGTAAPKMDITNPRSMEHLRRLGLADALRNVAVPRDHPMDIAWVTSMAGHELARFSYPSVDEARAIIRYVNDGTLALEPAMRVSQIVIEPELRRLLEQRDGIDTRFSTTLESFEQDDNGVDVVLRCDDGEQRRLRCRYLVGCDGGGSTVRRQLGIELEGTASVAELYMIHFRSEERAVLQRWGVAWHYQSQHGTLIAQDDDHTWTMHVAFPAGADEADLDARAMLFEALGCKIDCEILRANRWTPHLLVAENYRDRRVLLAGDAAHQYIPTGGYGMNTGVSEAANLGWKLAAVLHGWGGACLLDSYQRERRPVALRNRDASGQHMSVRLPIMEYCAKAAAFDGRDDDEARLARVSAGLAILELGNAENESLGLEMGYCYSDSPVVCHEDGPAPAFDALRYQPSTRPGVRSPSAFLADGRALFDLIGKGFTLARFAYHDVSRIERAAAACGLPLTVLDLLDPGDDAVRCLYERDLVLIRPDQHVAWRGNSPPADPAALIDLVRGASP